MRSRFQLAGHPVHLTLVNFPVALFSTALLFDLVYVWQRDSLWYWVAFYDMVVGYVGGVAAGVDGVAFSV